MEAGFQGLRQGGVEPVQVAFEDQPGFQGCGSDAPAMAAGFLLRLRFQAIFGAAVAGAGDQEAVGPAQGQGQPRFQMQALAIEGVDAGQPFGVAAERGGFGGEGVFQRPEAAAVADVQFRQALVFGPLNLVQALEALGPQAHGEAPGLVAKLRQPT